MTRQILGIALLALALGACSQQTDDSTSDATTAVADSVVADAPLDAQTSAIDPATASAPNAAAGNDAIAAVANEGSVSADDVDSTPSDASLERLTQLPPQDQLPAGRWQVGRHYQPIVPAQPTSVAPGKVEVVEVFWYGCNHCFALDPFLESWKQKKPDFIEFVRVPVTWAAWHKSHARLFYALQALKRDDLHAKVFAATQAGGSLQAQESEDAMLKAQIAFMKANGVSEEDFRREVSGFFVSTAVQRAEQTVRRFKVEGVPFMVVAGKYSTDVGSAGGQTQLTQLLTDLATSEKRR